MSDIDKLLNKDEILGCLNELSKDLENFQGSEIILMAWEKEGQIKHRAYGTSSEILGLLAKIQYILVRDTVGETRDVDE